LRNCFALLTASLVGQLVTSAPTFARAPFPLQPGEAVVTCAPPTPGSFVMGVVDVRDPGCDPSAVLGDNWPAPSYHNELPNPTNNAADAWTSANVGIVFGITLDDADTPSIYVSST